MTHCDREWLANKLVMASKSADASAEERKTQFLKLAGSWAESAESEEYYKTMRQRNENRPINRTYHCHLKYQAL